jgi:hypothetical protein
LIVARREGQWEGERLDGLAPHDAADDQQQPLIRERFGERVSRIVANCSDAEALPNLSLTKGEGE